VAELLPIVVFLIVSIIVAVMVRRRHAGGDFIDEYFIGNRSMGGFVLALTTVATYGSVSSFVGGPGQAWEYGFGWVYMATVQVTALILLYGILGKKLALVGRRIHAVTVIDIIRARYNSNALAVLSAVVMLLFFAATMVAQFVGGAKLFAAVTGYSYTLGLAIFGIAVILFTVIGGFRGVVLTDVLCGIVMLVGLGILAWGVLSAGGGLETIMGTIAQNHPEMLEPHAGGKMPDTLYFTQWLLVGVFTFCLPQSMVRCVGARDTRALRRAMVIGTVVIGAMMIVATGLGVLAAGVLTDPLSAYGNSVDNIIPIAIAQTLPSWLAGIAIVGPLAASISTVSSLLIASGSAMIKDLWLHRVAERVESADGGTDCVAGNKTAVSLPSESRVEGASRIITLAIGVLVFVLALVPPDLIWKINMFAFGGLETAFVWVMVCGLFWRRATKAGALASMAGGVLTYCTCMALGIKVFGMHQIVIGVLVAFVLMVVVSLVTKGEDDKTLALFFPPKR